MVTSIGLKGKEIYCTGDDKTTVILHAAGSLSASLSELAQAFTQEYGIRVRLEFDHSGLIRERLLNGEYSDIFASADMGNPLFLAKVHRSSPVVNFIRNRMCAIAKPNLKVNSDNLLDLMLDSKIKLGTSTPHQDPSGDYAQQIFQKAEQIRSGSFEILSQKALHLLGKRDSPVPKGKNKFAYFINETHQADIFLSYCTGAKLALKAEPSLQIIELPKDLVVTANYGMTLMNNASSAGMMLATYILSLNGQKILAKYGFDSSWS
ncbi:molybdate ABC transporter substrate-binding protein [Nostoc punctiforme UO1]|uniref:molybdate ABC transporter substrate-binding protein n=1 Tax=Nostoc punctiforme TaxID=272131 RepID=UPI0030A33E4B